MEMAQEIKGLAAKPEDLSSVFGAYVVEEAGLTKVSSGFCTCAVAQTSARIHQNQCSKTKLQLGAREVAGRPNTCLESTAP